MLYTYQTAELFETAQRRGWFYRMGQVLRGRSPFLTELDAVLAGRPVLKRRNGGGQIVPIAQIRGSEGRRRDFDAGFHPLGARIQQRWRGVAEAWLRGTPLPPVELLQIGAEFFVRDGHHRISVAAMMGQDVVDASVTVLDLGVQPVTRETTPGMLKVL